MRDAARESLSRIDSLRPGQGMLDAYLYGRGTLGRGSAGAGVDYSHRISESLSAFAQAEAGYQWDDETSGLAWQALTGVRWRW